MCYFHATPIMADKTNRRQVDDVIWSKIAPESCEDDAYIPGLSAPGNKRPGRIHAKKTKEIKPKIPGSQPMIESTSSLTKSVRYGSLTSKTGKPRKPSSYKSKDTQSFPFEEKYTAVEDSGMSTTFESFAEKSIHRLKQASLKDLRPEDKQRVANLIKELARVGEEKERAVKDLHGERQQYEQQLMKMVEQQETILKEREDVQEKLFQCQKLLTEYQSQLLNKQDRLNSSISEMKQDEFSQEQYNERQSRQVTRQPTNHITDNKPTANQNDRNIDDQDGSESNFLLNPADTIKRPYTSMIDKEIARERSRSRSLSQGSQRSMSRSLSPSEGRPKFAYPQKINGMGPLREPLASSTQKSIEVTSQYGNETLRSKLSAIGHCKGQSQGHFVDNDRNRNDHVTIESNFEDSERMKSKVAFNDEEQYSDGAQVHSPNLKSASQMFNDPAYASYYKKLSPGGRKRELLKQRQALLDEQERLRKILEKQEQQLSHRKYEYDKRVELQKQRMDFYREGGKFPALKLDFESNDDKASINNDDAGKGSVMTGQSSHVEMYSPTPRENIEIVVRKTRYLLSNDGCQENKEVQVKSHVSMATSPISSPRCNKITISTSPVISQDSEDQDVPKFVDVATSISYRTPTKEVNDFQQGNLPLGCNRQRLDVNVSVPTLGEKTLNVLELVNSMEEDPISPSQPIRLRGSRNQPMRIQEHSKQPIRDQYDHEIALSKTYTPNKYILHQKENDSPSYKQKTSPATHKVLHNKQSKMEDEESMEENKILEDIFFL
ncbi:hypothetical protein ACF0H5_024117 [Mactra antiquata]